MRDFLCCVVESVAENGIEGLANMVPGGAFAVAVAKGAWEKWRRRRTSTEQAAEIQRLAQATLEQVKSEANEVVREVFAGKNLMPLPPQVASLDIWLSGIPEATRTSLRRADDPSGRSLPPGLVFRDFTDVEKLLPPVPKLLPGSPLPERAGWVLDRLLGIGGYGEVWLARNPRYASLCGAVKFCHGEQARELQHEAGVIDRVLSARQHPGVVLLKDVHLEGSSPWLMYEYIAGGTLADWVYALQRVTPERRQAQIVVGLKQLVDAVGFFHQLDPPIIHRDLKPSNILLNKTSKKLQITDFGIGAISANASLRAEARGETTHSGRLFTSMRGSHTKLYASPQQASGAEPDPRDDIHALGVIGYQMFTGNLTTAPGRDMDDDLHEAGASGELIELLGKCVAQKAERRPKNAAELAARLATLGRLEARPAVATEIINSPPAVVASAQSEGDGVGQETIQPQQTTDVLVPQNPLQREYKSIDAVPSSVLTEAILSCVTSGSMGVEDLIAAVFRRLGFRRTGPRIRERIAEAMNRLFEEDRVQLRHDGIIERAQDSREVGNSQPALVLSWRDHLATDRVESSRGVRILNSGPASIAAPLTVSPFQVDRGKMSITCLLLPHPADDQGDIVEPGGCDWSEHEVNPIVMFHHGLDFKLPIGKAEDPNGNYTVRHVKGDDGRLRLIGTTYFSQSSPFATDVFELIAENILPGVSVGFEPLDGSGGVEASGNSPALKRARLRFNAWKLLEYSHTLRGLNRAALTDVVRKALYGERAMHPKLLRLLEPFAGKRPVTVTVGVSLEALTAETDRLIAETERLIAARLGACRALGDGDSATWDTHWEFIRRHTDAGQFKEQAVQAQQNLDPFLPTMPVKDRDRVRAICFESGAWPDHHLLAPTSLNELDSLLGVDVPIAWQGYTCFAVMGPDEKNWLLEDTKPFRFAMRGRVKQYLLTAKPEVLTAYLKHAKDYVSTIPIFLYDFLRPYRPESTAFLSRLIDAGASIIEPADWVKLLCELDIYGEQSTEWSGFLLKNDHLAKLLAAFKADPAGTLVWDGYLASLSSELLDGDEWERIIYNQLSRARDLIGAANISLREVASSEGARKLEAAETLLGLIENPDSITSVETDQVVEAFQAFGIEPIEGLQKYWLSSLGCNAPSDSEHGS